MAELAAEYLTSACFVKQNISDKHTMQFVSPLLHQATNLTRTAGMQLGMDDVAIIADIIATGGTIAAKSSSQHDLPKVCSLNIFYSVPRDPSTVNNPMNAIFMAKTFLTLKLEPRLCRTVMYLLTFVFPSLLRALERLLAGRGIFSILTVFDS